MHLTLSARMEGRTFKRKESLYSKALQTVWNLLSAYAHACLSPKMLSAVNHIRAHAFATVWGSGHAQT